MFECLHSTVNQTNVRVWLEAEKKRKELHSGWKPIWDLLLMLKAVRSMFRTPARATCPLVGPDRYYICKPTFSTLYHAHICFGIYKYTYKCKPNHLCIMGEESNEPSMTQSTYVAVSKNILHIMQDSLLTNIVCMPFTILACKDGATAPGKIMDWKKFSLYGLKCKYHVIELLVVMMLSGLINLPLKESGGWDCIKLGTLVCGQVRVKSVGPGAHFQSRLYFFYSKLLMFLCFSSFSWKMGLIIITYRLLFHSFSLHTLLSSLVLILVSSVST